MSNPYFRFKKFTIKQDQCAMKVCTDSCLFGAWVAKELKYKSEENINVLDIGAGTGLLSLMLAQKLPAANIDAVEIEPHCFAQAEVNIFQSPWKERIQVYQADINQFSSKKQYDVIISNPPFYESDLLSADIARNIAHHNAGLTLEMLLNTIKKYLTEGGCFAILLPYHRSVPFENLAAGEGFYAFKKLFVKQTPMHSFFRTFLLFSKAKINLSKDEIVIKDSDNHYTDTFVSLLKDYYLYL